MPLRLGVPELLIILVIVLLLFGVGRVGKIAGELGKGIRQFKDGMNGDEGTEEKKNNMLDTTEIKAEEIK
jgi:sec-independent protein translocase protein TatA